MQVSSVHPRVAELQGPYGPLQILEGKVQEVWALQQFQPGDWFTRSGQRLRVRRPGRWNRGAGPDFREAEIEVDGEVRLGDVELHLYREDWWRHGHHLDPAYDRVVLHVILFPGGMERPVRTAAGNLPGEWVMGPWMREDLEAVAGGEPGLFGEWVPELCEWIESEPPERIRERLSIGAERRWEAKESMARCLLEAYGWAGVLHRMTLFYLGFPDNRRPFYAMAEAHPPEAWQPGIVSLLKEQWTRTVRWNTGRPANRAARRLGEYLRLTASAPGWMERLRAVPEIPAPRSQAEKGEGFAFGLAGTTSGIRKAWCFPAWRRWLSAGVVRDTLSESLLDRLWIDVFLPVLVADGLIPRQEGSLFWFHVRPGLFPEAFPGLLRLAGIHSSTGFPLSNGWIQGLFWTEDQLRLERIRASR